MNAFFATTGAATPINHEPPRRIESAAPKYSFPRTFVSTYVRKRKNERQPDNAPAGVTEFQRNYETSNSRPSFFLFAPAALFYHAWGSSRVLP